MKHGADMNQSMAVCGTILSILVFHCRVPCEDEFSSEKGVIQHA